MPRTRCSLKGRPGVKWGRTGKCYTYIPGNKRSLAAAIRRMHLQRAAIKASQARRRP